jgi:predicted phage terminase large subunit-like protein
VRNRGPFFGEVLLDPDTIHSVIKGLPLSEQAKTLDLLEQLEKTRLLESADQDFLSFVKYLWPGFIQGHHHTLVAEAFENVVNGKMKRVIVSMAPRHTKSEFASVYLPAWYLGKNPDIDSKPFQELFQGVSLSADSKAAGRWNTNKGGEYFAIGVGGKLAGKGADILVIDDPHSEQEAVIAASNPEVYDRVVDWYAGGPRQRLQPGGSIVIVATRWSLRDLTGQLVKQQGMDPLADKWHVIELPAVLENGKPIWPEFWPLEELNKTKASIPVSKWNAQYQQNPTSEEGALVKRDWWEDWRKPDPPNCEIIIQSWDTAFTNKTRSDYSACTTWGVFRKEGKKDPCLILMDMIKGKWEFPELKSRALEQYHEFQPDICLIEARASGQPLIFELRSMGIPVQDVMVARGNKYQSNDKISRLNSITDIFASKMVYAPKEKKWAQETIEECAAFPAGENDDIVDTVIMALTRFRQGGWIRTNLDDEEDRAYRRRRADYY